MNTEAKLNTMQFEFDAVVTHLYAQGRPARTGGGLCKYRHKEGDNTLSCAVGCRIPDVMYKPEMEQRNVNLLLYHNYTLPAEIKAYEDMFTAVQKVHDNWPDTNPGGKVYTTDYLDEELPKVALEFGLIFTKPEQKAA